MRTEEQFTVTYERAEWFVRRHNKPVWLVPMKDKYEISILKPNATSLPKGTSAVLYNQKMEIIDTVDN